MNGRLDEQLSRLAFGDLSPQEAAALEARAKSDPEVAKVLNEYRSMYAGLRNLGSHVPADQLSKERLRDAILAQGLKTADGDVSAKRSWLDRGGWIMVPLAAGVLAFTVMNFRSKGEVAPRVILDPAANGSLLGMAGKSDLNFMASATGSTMVASAKAPKRKSVAPSTKTVVAQVASAPRRRKRPIVLESKFDPELVARIEEAKPKATKDTQVGSPSLSAANEPKVNWASVPIVLIDANKDVNTGANNATEVGTANNVLVGG